MKSLKGREKRESRIRSRAIGGKLLWKRVVGILWVSVCKCINVLCSALACCVVLLCCMLCTSALACCVLYVVY